MTKDLSSKLPFKLSPEKTVKWPDILFNSKAQFFLDDQIIILYDGFHINL